MIHRFWRWYFWGTPPMPYATRGSRVRRWLWWHTHPRWLGDIRTALLRQQAEAACRNRPPGLSSLSRYGVDHGSNR